MSEQTKIPQMEKMKGERDTHAETNKENRSIDDTEMEEISGGANPKDDYDPFHKLPDGSGSSDVEVV